MSAICCPGRAGHRSPGAHQKLLPWFQVPLRHLQQRRYGHFDHAMGSVYTSNYKNACSPKLPAMRSGFFWTLRDILKCREDGLVTAGVPCSSFIFLSVGSSGRSDCCPLGRDVPFVNLANNIVARVSLLLVICLLRSVSFSVEQPNSTKLFMLPYMTYMRELAECFKLDFFERFLPSPQLQLNATRT